MGALTISDVMGKLPGVDAGTPGADGSMAMRSRGMTRDSVQIFIDGERVAGNARMAQAMVGRLPSTELERVEIVRGASAEFGGNAPVSVNLVFTKARSKESTALKAALGFRNDEPNAQFSVHQGRRRQGVLWVLPVTMNFHNMPSARQLTRQDSTGHGPAGPRRRPLRGSRKRCISPRFTWKSGTDSLTVAPSLFRAFGTRSNDSTRTDFAAPARRQHPPRRRAQPHRLQPPARGRRDGSQGHQVLGALRRFRRRAPRRRQAHHDRRARRHQRRHRAEPPRGAATSTAPSASTGRSTSTRWPPPSKAPATGATTASRTAAASRGDEKHSGSDEQWSLWVQDEWGIVEGHHAHRRPARRSSSATTWTASAGATSACCRRSPCAGNRRSTGCSAPRSAAASSRRSWTNSPPSRSTASAPIRPPSPTAAATPTCAPSAASTGKASSNATCPARSASSAPTSMSASTQDFIERRVGLEGTRWVERPWNEGNATHWGMEFDGKVRTDSLGWSGATLRAHLTLPRSRVHDERLGITACRARDPALPRLGRHRPDHRPAA